MTEFKGTNGKWFISSIDEPNEHNDNTGCHILSVESKDRYGFIDVWFGDSFQCGNKNEALYNALLISKAPEMLEMLKSVKDLLEAYPSEAEIHLKAVEIRDLIKEATEL